MIRRCSVTSSIGPVGRARYVFACAAVPLSRFSPDSPRIRCCRRGLVAAGSLLVLSFVGQWIVVSRPGPSHPSSPRRPIRCTVQARQDNAALATTLEACNGSGVHRICQALSSHFAGDLGAWQPRQLTRQGDGDSGVLGMSTPLGRGSIGACLLLQGPRRLHLDYRGGSIVDDGSNPLRIFAAPSVLEVLVSALHLQSDRQSGGLRRWDARWKGASGMRQYFSHDDDRREREVLELAVSANCSLDDGLGGTPHLTSPPALWRFK